MKLSLIKIQSIFPHFNERPITADDFWNAVAREKVKVRQMPMIVDGYYTYRRKKHVILINSNLSGYQWLHTALHEFYHYLFDVPSADDGFAFYRNGEYIDRREYKADAFAVMGIMPWNELLKITVEEVENNRWLAEIVRDRIVVRTHFGM